MQTQRLPSLSRRSLTAKTSAAASSVRTSKTWPVTSLSVPQGRCSTSFSVMVCQRGTYRLLSCWAADPESQSCKLSLVMSSMGGFLTSECICESCTWRCHDAGRVFGCIGHCCLCLANCLFLSGMWRVCESGGDHLHIFEFTC